MLLESLFQYFIDNSVQVGVENQAKMTLEVPSVLVCPYTRDVKLIYDAPAAGGMNAVIRQWHSSHIPKECVIFKTQDPTQCETLLDPQTGTVPCCCFLPDKDLHWVCETNPRNAIPSFHLDRMCHRLDLSMFRLHNLVSADSLDPLNPATASKYEIKETIEVRMTYAVDSSARVEAHNALKIGLYSDYAKSHPSFFYVDVGSLAIGTLSKATYTQKDWLRYQSYDDYVPQYTQMDESYGRGVSKCKTLPPLHGRNDNIVKCTKDGCEPTLKTRTFNKTQSHENVAGTNFCTRFHFEFSEYFITKGVTFGSMTNCWALLALFSVLATQLNNLNLISIIFPRREKKVDTREVNRGMWLLTCGLIGTTHQEDSSSSDEEV